MSGIKYTNQIDMKVAPKEPTHVARLQDAMVKGTPGTYTQGVDFDGPNLPSFQEFVDANISNRFFNGAVTLELHQNDLPAAQDHLIENMLTGDNTFRIETSVRLGRYLHLKSIVGGVNLVSTAPQVASRVYANYIGRFAMQGVKATLVQTWGTNRVVFQRGTDESIEIGTLTAPGCFCSVETGEYDITIDTANLQGGCFEVGLPYTGKISIGNIGETSGQIIDNRPGRPLETFIRRGERDDTFTTIPDYAAIETVNRISALNQTWTADRDGFVLLRGTNADNATLTWQINGTTVQSHGMYTVSMSLTAGVHPVKAGDVVSCAVNVGSATGLGCFYIPPRYVWATTPATPFNTRLIGQPDYAKMELINRIDTMNGTWTVDRDGYVRLGGNSGSGTFFWNINGFRITYSPAGSALNTIEAVSKGDVITASGTSTDAGGISCYFVPPISTAPMFITGADLQQGTLPGQVEWDVNTKVMSVIDGATQEWANGQFIQQDEGTVILANSDGSPLEYAENIAPLGVSFWAVSNQGNRDVPNPSVGCRYLCYKGSPASITLLAFTSPANTAFGNMYINTRRLEGWLGWQLVNNPNYSTSEHLTGRNWIDGNPIYRRVLTGTSATAGGDVMLGSSIAGIGTPVSVSGFLVNTSNVHVPIGYSTSNNSFVNAVVHSNGQVTVRTANAASDNSRPVTVIQEYTKAIA